MILNLEAGSVYLVVVRNDESYSFVRMRPEDVFRSDRLSVTLEPAVAQLREMEGAHIVANATP